MRMRLLRSVRDRLEAIWKMGSFRRSRSDFRDLFFVAWSEKIAFIIFTRTGECFSSWSGVCVVRWMWLLVKGDEN